MNRWCCKHSAILAWTCCIATVGTALHRLKNEGMVLRFADGWDLASHYPDGLRARLEKAEKA